VSWSDEVEREDAIHQNRDSLINFFLMILLLPWDKKEIHCQKQKGMVTIIF